MLYHLGTENEKALLFIDIIGFSELVKNSDGFNANDGQPHEIALIFPVFYNSIANHYSKEYQKKRDIKFLWASDTIVISTDIDNINTLIEDLIYLQNQFYCGSLAFRGVITIGNLYHEDNIWGEALVRASDIEKHKVKYPRVIISKEEYSQLSISKQFQNYFVQDELNEDFLTFEVFNPNIDIILNKPELILHSTLNVYKQLIIENFNKAPSEVKYRWRWMAGKLYTTIEESYTKILNRLKQEAEREFENCNLDKIINDLNAIMVVNKWQN